MKRSSRSAGRDAKFARRSSRSASREAKVAKQGNEDPKGVCVGSVHDRMLETLSKSLPRRMQAACKDHASTLQALCKHPASPLQADTFYLQATIWHIAGVQVLARLQVFKSPPKCLYYNINKELSPEKCAILARRGVLSSKSFQNFTRPPCSPKAALKGSTPLEFYRVCHL